MRIKFNGRELADIELEDLHRWDSPDYCDAFIANARWADTGAELTDDELDKVNEDRDLVHDAVYNYIF